MQNNTILTILAASALAACGGAPKTGLKAGADVPPPPPNGQERELGRPARPEPKREVSKDARKDFEAAAAAFAQNDKGSWNESACRGTADRVRGRRARAPDLVEAQFMVGRRYHRCNLLQDAERAYQQAIKMKANHGASLSNLGEIYYRAGKLDGAQPVLGHARSRRTAS